jgi:hypothetical protein
MKAVVDQIVAETNEGLGLNEASRAAQVSAAV